MKRNDVIDFLNKPNTKWSHYITLNIASTDLVEIEILLSHYRNICTRKLYGKRFRKHHDTFDLRGVFETGSDGTTPHLHLFVKCSPDKETEFTEVSNFAWTKLRNNRGSETIPITQTENDYTRLFEYNSKEWNRKSFSLMF